MVSADLLDPVLAIGIVLSLKRVAEMDRYHALRVVVLTVILSCMVIYLFLSFAFPSYRSDDCIDFGNHYCQTEF